MFMERGRHDQFPRAESMNLESLLQQICIQKENGPGILDSGQHALDEQLMLEEHESVCLESAPMQMDCEADPLQDPVFNYISDMLMDDENTEERTCMFIDCSGYQAMAQELTEMISDSPSPDSNKVVDSWIDGLLNAEEEELPVHSAGESVVESEESSHDSVLVSEPEPVADDVFDRHLNNYLGNIQSDIEKSAVVTSPTTSSNSEVNKPDANQGERQQDALLGLKSILVECVDFLKSTSVNDTQVCEHPLNPPFLGDLLSKHNQVEAGEVWTVPVDSKALETQKAIRVELHSLLMECAQAVASDDMARAYDIVNRIRDRVSSHGTGTERMTFYFAEALVARITGTGGLLYSALASNRPPVCEMLKAYRLFVRFSPNIRISHFFCNQSILDASEGAKRVHLIDYGILYGFGWPCLIKAFSAREGGPPHLRITGIDFPQPGYKPAERIEDTGRRLSEYAKQVGVPFEFQAIAAAKWESVQQSTLFLRHDEVLIVNSTFRLRHLLDESVMVDSPRKLVLSRIANMRPKVFVQSVVNAHYNAPFFLSRFREALNFYSVIFEAIDSSVAPERPERLLIEQSIIGREILNVVACEGLERVERAEPYKHWQSRTQKAGFEQLPLMPELYAKARAMLSTYHKGFGIGQDGNWLLLGWKETVLHAMSTWRTR